MSKTNFILSFVDKPLQQIISTSLGKPADEEVKGVLPINDQLSNFFDNEYFFQRRFKLEKDESYRHPIPYGVFYRVNANNEPEYFVYQRTPATSEGRLAGNLSIGVGGHIEAAEHFNLARETSDESQSHVLSFYEIINRCLGRELDEEFVFEHDITDDHGDEKITVPRIMINSDNGVDRFHLGLVPFTRLPNSAHNPSAREDDNIAVGFYTKAQLLEDELFSKLESWSQLILKSEHDQYFRLNTVTEEVVEVEDTQEDQV